MFQLLFVPLSLTCFGNLIISLSLTRPQYVDDSERLGLIDDALNRLSDCASESPIHSMTAGRSSSRELSGTLKVMKRVEQVFQGKFVILLSRGIHHEAGMTFRFAYFGHQRWTRSCLKTF